MIKYKTVIRKADNNSAATIGVKIIDTINNSGLENIISNPAYKKFLADNDVYQSCVAQDAKNMARDSVKSNELIRKNLFLELHSYVAGMLSSPNEDSRNSAIIVFEKLDMYGKSFVHKRKVDQVVAYIRITEALKDPNLLEHLTKLEIADKAKALVDIQASIEAAQINLIKTNVKYPAASRVRNNFNKSVILFMDDINIKQKTEEDIQFNILFEHLLEIFNIVRLSAYRKSKPEEDAEKPQTNQ